MSFRIITPEQNFSLTEFPDDAGKEPWLQSASLFVKNWVQNKPFTFYSSGSTGKPKAHVFHKWQLEISARATIHALQLRPGNEHILLCLNPKFVGGAMMLARAILLDCPITILEPARDVFAKIPSDAPYTFASFVPMQLMHESFSKIQYEQIEKVLIGGTSIPFVLDELFQTCSNKSYQTYGMTETLSHIALKELGKANAYRVIEPYTIRLNEQECICIRAPFSEDEIITRDRAVWVSENEFQLLGRMDFIINSGGIKINPEQVEDCISKMDNNPLPTGYLIAKMPHDTYGEQAVLVSDSLLSDADFQRVLNHLRGFGFQYELPKTHLQLPELPLTESGKPDRLKVNEWLDNQSF